jgi:hypothetical protein
MQKTYLKIIDYVEIKLLNKKKIIVTTGYQALRS